MLHAGCFLKSTDLLNDTLFEQALIFIVEYNSGGAIGYVMNKKFSRRLNELIEFAHAPAFPLFEGGPVDPEHLFFVHCRPDLVKEGVRVNDVYHGGNFKQAVLAISEGILSTSEIKIFIGYCGWDAGELEAEIEEGSWSVIENENVFG